MKYIIIIIVALAVGFGADLIRNKIIEEKKPKKQEEEPETLEETKTEKMPYIRKNLMTKNEWGFYKALKPVADKLNYSVICKTRVADLVEVEKGLTASERQAAFNRINKKHIDFVLCKPENLYPILLIELDDSSHDTEKGKVRDEFIEKLYEKTGYRLLRTKGTANLEEQITKALQ